MSLINGVGLNTSVPYVNQQKTTKQNTKNVSFQSNSEKSEKTENKNGHKLLKALIVAGLVVGGYLLFKKRSVIGDKLKNLFDKLKNKSGEATTSSGVRQEQAVPDVVKTDKQPFKTSAEEIDLNLGIGRPFKSAEESVAAFEAHGLTDFEKQLKTREKLKIKGEKPSRGGKTPRKNEVIDTESSTLPNHKLRGRDNARKARHNEKRIIEEARNSEI